MAGVVVIVASVVATFNDASEFVQRYSLPSFLGLVGVTVFCIQVVWLTGAVVFGSQRRIAAAGLTVALAVGGFTGWRLWQDVTGPERDPVAAVDPVDDSYLRDESSRTILDRTLASEDLSRTDYSNSVLRNVDLENASLDESSLRNATLDDVNLAGASLCGVDARKANFRSVRGLGRVANWNYLLYDETTRWPDTFDVEAHAGPVLAWTGSHLYTCTAGEWSVRSLE